MVDHDPSNVRESSFSAAVIRMIIEGRSPNLRHVARIHRVGLDWLIERISAIQCPLDMRVQQNNWVIC